MAEENTNYINYLIDMSKSGRQRGFLELCEINLRNVFTVVYRLLNDMDSAKVVTARTFMKSWHEIEECPKHKLFQYWIKSIAINLAMEELENVNYSSQQNTKPPTSNDEVEHLEYFIKQLAVQERTIFILHDLEGYPYNEIQQFFPGMIEDEIKTILISTRQLLIAQLGL